MPAPLSPPVPLPAPRKLSRLGRALAAAQALKETLSFLLLLVPLAIALRSPLVLVSALPGLVLYGLHLYLVGGRASRLLALVAWGLTLADELWAVFLYHDLGAPLAARRLHLSHWLGVGLSLLALAELAWHPRRRRRAAPAGSGAGAGG